MYLKILNEVEIIDEGILKNAAGTVKTLTAGRGNFITRGINTAASKAHAAFNNMDTRVEERRKQIKDAKIAQLKGLGDKATDAQKQELKDWENGKRRVGTMRAMMGELGSGENWKNATFGNIAGAGRWIGKKGSDLWSGARKFGSSIRDAWGDENAETNEMKKRIAAGLPATPAQERAQARAQAQTQASAAAPAASSPSMKERIGNAIDTAGSAMMSGASKLGSAMASGASKLGSKTDGLWTRTRKGIKRFFGNHETVAGLTKDEYLTQFANNTGLPKDSPQAIQAWQKFMGENIPTWESMMMDYDLNKFNRFEDLLLY